MEKRKDMKQNFRLLAKSMLLVLICTFVGLALLLAVFALPTDGMEANLCASADIFEQERSSSPITIIANSRTDTFSDAVMLLQAAYTNDTGLLDRTLSVYSPGIDDWEPNQILAAHYGDGEPINKVNSYARYWHGYLVFLKPILNFFDYSEIRLFNAFAVAIVATILVLLMFYGGLKRYILPYVIALLIIDPFAISRCLHFSSDYYIYSLASILLIWKFEWFERSIDRLVLFFTFVGCATSYLDLLTAPFITFGVPAVFYLCMTKKNVKESAWDLFRMMIAWFVGYVGLWIIKWILATVFTADNIIMDGINTVLFRTSMPDGYGFVYSVVQLFMSLLPDILTPASFAALAYILVCAVLLVWRRKIKKPANYNWLIYIAIAVLPIIWFVGASNHSFIHHWFAYREVIITAFSLMCLFSRYSAKTME